MATRENQGLQAFVIIATIALLISVVGLVLLNNARKTQFARAESELQAKNQMQQQMATAQGEATGLKEMIGFADTDTMDAIRAAFDEEMKKYAPGVDAESLKYRLVLGNVFEEKEKLVLNVSTATEETKKLKDRLLAVETQKDEQVKKFAIEMEKVRKDMATERQKYEDEYTRINTAKDGIQKQMDEMRTAHEKALAELDNEKKQLEIKIDSLTLSIDKLREGVPNPDQFAQPADGQITWVDQANRVVWVNLGSADGLRPQVTFAIAEAGLEDAATAEQKGSIEVTQILGPHMAEARITKDDATNPLLPRDRVFSQVWDRGRQVGIAIAGVIDIDKDGKSDLDRLKSIITANGGVVDAAPDASGKREGEIKVSTRYLVLGEYPNDARDGALRQSWTELSDDATSLGVQTIALSEFLSLMGWQSEGRSVAMGPGARAEDFPVTARDTQSPRKTGQPAGVFKPRLPKTTY